jgi:hypothetical protein
VSKRHLVPASFVACISQLAALALPACADPYGQIVAASASAGDDAGDTTDSGAGDDAGIPIDVEPDPWLTEVYAPVQQQAAQMSVDAFLQEYPKRPCSAPSPTTPLAPSTSQRSPPTPA